jgi:CubicO group peptidase (beta-lactamase class C family)
MGLDQLLQARVWGPLGMRDTGYSPAAALRPRIAATELGNQYERAMLERLGVAFADWRDYLQVGEVNDGNTFYALGGISSHAGLFSSAPDLLRFASRYLGGGTGVLSPATLAEACSDHTGGLARSRGLGWEVLRKGRLPRAEWAPSAATARVHGAARYTLPVPRPYGDLLSGRTFGHTGFTGTSLAIDPERGLVVVLLTNRTHPTVNEAIGWLRPRFHNLVAAALTH